MTDLLILSDPVSDFWKCPNFVWHFLTTFCYMFGLIGSINFINNPVSWHECRPIYGLHFVYIGFLSFIQKGGFEGPTNLHCKFLAVFGHFAHQNG